MGFKMSEFKQPKSKPKPKTKVKVVKRWRKLTKGLLRMEKLKRNITSATNLKKQV